MAGYRVLIVPSAVKEIEAVPLKDRRRIVARIRALSGDPRPTGCEKLSGQEKYRVRQGDYRILYALADEVPAVTVVKVAHLCKADR